jgi:hypothetical protein
MIGNTKPSITALVSAVKEHQKLDITSDDITTEIYEAATRGFEKGVSIKSMSNRVKFYLVSNGGDREEKETVSHRGVFIGSSDIVNENKPLGKNKSQSLSFLSLGDDDFLRVMSDPNSPSHFKGFKKGNFGALVDVDFSSTKQDSGITYVTPESVTPIDKSFVIDTGKIKAYDTRSLLDIEKYTPCAVVGTISSIKALRIPNWEQHKYDEDQEDYPLTIKGNPVFQFYLSADTDNGEPIVKGYVNPTNIAKPFIALDDFEAMWPQTPADLEGADIDEFLRDEITAMYNGVEVILIGQRKNDSEYDDKTYIDFYVNAIIPVENAPSLIEVASGVDRAKAAKEAKAESKKESTEEAAAKDAKKMAVRQKKVAATVEAMRDATTPQIVRDMVDKAIFLNVEDSVIQTMIENEFEAQGISAPEEVEAPAEDDTEASLSDTEGDDEIWNE